MRKFKDNVTLWFRLYCKTGSVECLRASVNNCLKATVACRASWMGKGRERARRAFSLILSGLGSVILLGECWRVICKTVASVPQVIEMRCLFHWNPMRKSMRSGAGVNGIWCGSLGDTVWKSMGSGTEVCGIQSRAQPFWLSEPVVCRRVVRHSRQAGFVPPLCLAGISVAGRKRLVGKSPFL